ncbi:hypothetical protein [Nitratireductor pacificus]|nr:hypothetical protein [Nitratireductor pacificus]
MITESQRRLIHNALSPQLEITWEDNRKLVNTELYVALMRPSTELSDTFGFDKEIAFFLSPYPTLQPRSMQALEQICSEHPLAGRIDPTVALFHSPDPRLENWILQYHSENPESRMIVPLTNETITRCIDDRWSLVNALKKTLFIRNLFDYKLPLKSDRYFYGREDIVAAIIDNVRKSQNSGLFGLRKTGKTSVLLKVQRNLQKSKDVETIFLDCKIRPIRRSSCDDLAARIISEIDKIFGKRYLKELGSVEVFDLLTKSIRSIPSKKKLCLIFDEIEYISPISPTDIHWSTDFIDFWQALWTIQSQCDKIAFVVCGVNPTVCDIDRFDSPTVPGRTVQNPMFSIFNVHYLKGLSPENLRNMIEFFGSRMGLFFQKEAIDLLYQEYGGHPLLTRLACSFQHEQLEAQGSARPTRITKEDIVACAQERDAELSSYCGHVVSEIAELYPDEYELLKTLAAGEIADFAVLASRHEDVRHIRDYGLVHVESGSVPTFRIPVVKRYLKYTERDAIAKDEANRFGSYEQRLTWVRRRSRSIIDDLILFNDGREESSLPTMYRKSSNLKGHTFLDIGVVDDETSAVAFLVHTHKHIVEPADKFLRGGVAKNDMVKSELPILRHSFMRLKAYRNKFCHIELTPETEKAYSSFINEDFDGIDVSAIEDGWFKMQRRVLDNIHIALQTELSRI